MPEKRGSRAPARSAAPSFAVQPLRRAAPAASSAAAGPPADSSALAPARSSEDAVEDLTRLRLGPFIFDGESHSLRFRVLNGRVEAGLNPEWQSLEQVEAALLRRGTPDAAVGLQILQQLKQALALLEARLKLRPSFYRDEQVETLIAQAQFIASGLHRQLGAATAHIDYYGGTLHGNGPGDTDVVGFDASEATPDEIEYEDTSDEFEPDDVEFSHEAPSQSFNLAPSFPSLGVASSSASVPNDDVTMLKADGPPVPLDAGLRSELRQVQQGGAPLPRELRSFFESRFRVPLAPIRLHTDDRADRLGRLIHARAFTVGQHIAVRRDQYAPHTTAGRWLLAHELAHAVSSRPAAGAARRLGGTRDYAEREADRTADAVMQGPLGIGEPLPAAAADGVVRRAPQGTFADPLKIALYKDSSIYEPVDLEGYSGGTETFSPFVPKNLPTPRMRTAQAVHGAPVVLGAVKGVTIGVQNPNNLVGQIVKRVKSPKRKVESIFKTALAGQGFDWSDFAPDHIQDLALSGPDKFPNLWPLDSTTNSAANQTYGQKVAVDGYAKPRSVKGLVGKYFKITKLEIP